MSEKYLTCALYKFVSLPAFEALREPLHRVLVDNHVLGTLLLAKEGINGTIAGLPADVESVLDWLDKIPELSNIDQKLSYHSEIPFHRTNVKLKKEGITHVYDKDNNQVSVDDVWSEWYENNKSFL